MNRRQLSKNLAVLAVVLIGALLALPTFFPNDPALDVRNEDGSPILDSAFVEMRRTLEESGVEALTGDHRAEAARLRFANHEDQARAADVLGQAFDGVVIAFDLEPRLPTWLRALGLEPVSLGLDLSGGVHFVYEVDLDAVADRLLETRFADVRAALRDVGIPAASRMRGDAIVVELRHGVDGDAARDAIRGLDDPFSPGAALDLRESATSELHVLELSLPPDVATSRQNLAMEQNIATLRNRVDALGVAESIVQRQGHNRILVQVPGVQDPSQLDRILGSTATLEWRLEDTLNDARAAARTNRTPPSSILRFEDDGTPHLLRREVIASGEHLTDASFGYQEGRPGVTIRLDGQGARRMLEATQANVGKPLAVLMIEETRVPDSSAIEQTGAADPRAGEAGGDGYRLKREERVIFVGRIEGVFSTNFRLSGGFTPSEAQDLALVLRSGALAAPIFKDYARTVGPSLGQDNIRAGRHALIVGFLAVVTFMAAYYRGLGMIANLALLANLVIMIGLLSLIPGASLTLPGMAGIVLTLGMAVDANVLIIERIRDELAQGNSPRISIMRGYDKAWSSIADANITTLIAGIALLAFGTGPIKGFAVTLSLGVLTSMFTAVAGTRALVELFYGKREAGKLSGGGPF